MALFSGKDWWKSVVDPMGLVLDKDDPNAGKAEQYLRDSLGEFDGLQAPEYEALDVNAPDFDPIAFQQYQDLGDYKPQSFITPGTIDAGKDVEYKDVDPRLADLEKIDRSKFEDIASDPAFKGKQMASLGALDDIIAGGGLTLKDQANLAKIQGEVASQDQGRRESIKQNMAMRGMGGSGLELLQQLQSNQAATDRSSQAGLDTAAMAQQRELDAIMQSGTLASGMRDQDFSEQAKRAAASDAIAQFNAANTNQNSQWNANTTNQAAMENAQNKLGIDQYNRNIGIDTQKANVGNSMSAQQMNASTANQASLINNQRKQTLANSNADLSNQQKTTNQNLEQQNFQNKLGIAQANQQGKQQAFQNQLGVTNAKAGANQAGMNYYQGQSDQKSREDANRMGSLVKIGTTAAMMMSDEREKKSIKTISDDEISEFLSALQPKKFKYKDASKPGAAEGQRLGLVAQDIEETKLGKDIVKTDKDGTKMLDKDNLLGVILASLAKGNK